MRRVFAVAALLATTAAADHVAAAPVPADDQCLGRWQGRGRNTGHPEYWTIDLTLTANPTGGPCGTIEYENPKCGGTLESCEKKGKEIHTRELYKHGVSDCAPAGRVIIVCEGDQLRYSWIGWERVDTVLTRVKQQAQDPPPAPTSSRLPPRDASAPDDDAVEEDERDEEESDDDEEGQPRPARGCMPSCSVVSGGEARWWLLPAVLAGWRRRRSATAFSRTRRW